MPQMPLDLKNLREALQLKQLNLLTKAVGEIAQKHEYNLKPPFTEITRLRAEQEDRGYAIEFSATLNLHYTALPLQNEGLVFSVRFSGYTHADSPNPPVQELFSSAIVDDFVVYGYGNDWPGQMVSTPERFLRHLEVPALAVSVILTETFV